MPDLPRDMEWKPVILPTPTKDGVFVFYQYEVFTLIWQQNQWIWKKHRQLQTYREWFVAFYIPDDITTCI